MAAEPLMDLAQIDLEKVIFDREEIEKRNPHRHEMQLLDRIIHFDPAEQLIVGTKLIRDDEFWVRGHFPQGAIFPGVLMVEAGGQLCSFYTQEVMKHGRVMGFAAADDVRFRGKVVPGDELVLIGKAERLIPRRGARFRIQGYVAGKLAVECRILGMFL